MKDPAPGLADIQKGFWELIAAPEGARKGQRDLEAAGVLPEGFVDAVFVGDERRSAIDRVDVYANMYFFRLKDAIREDFPKVALLAGEPAWHDLMTDYVLAHPPVSWSMRYAGQHLPAFLAVHPLAEGRPWLADLARLEWARADAFQQRDEPVLPIEALSGVAPEAWGELAFRAAGCVTLIEASAGVGQLWADLEEAADPSPDAAPSQEPETLLVFREGLDVFHESLEGAEGRAGSALLSGCSFAEVCERAAGDAASDDDVEVAAQVAAGILLKLLNRGLITGFAA